MFPYLRMRKEFLDSCDTTFDNAGNELSNDELDKIKTIINNAMRYRTTTKGKPYTVQDSDYQSWGESMKLFRPIMEALGNDVGISFEFMLDYRNDNGQASGDMSGFNRRTDVMVGGLDNNGKMALVVVEMKRWSHGDKTNYLRENNGVLQYYPKHKEDNPTKDVKKYCEDISNQNSKVKNGDITLIPVVWLYNYDETMADESIVNLLKNPIDENGNEIKDVEVFFANQEERVKAFFERKFEAKNMFVFSEFRKGFPIVKLHEELDRILSEDAGKSIRFRGDQQYCYDCLTGMIKGGNKGLKYIKGRAGSGKSIVGIMLLKYCLVLGKKVRYVIPEGAPVKAYTQKGEQNTINTSEIIRTAEQNFTKLGYGDDDKLDVLIVDEAHSLFEDYYKKTILKYTDKSLIVILYDNNQGVTDWDNKTLCDFDKLMEEENEEPFLLDSQFRCNFDEGYLTFVDDVLDGTDSGLTADMLDFDIRLVQDEDKLSDLAKEKDGTGSYKFVIVASPYYAENKKEIGSIKRTNENWTELFSHRGPGTQNSYGDYTSVRGLEADNFLVMISEKDVKYDNSKVTCKDVNTNKKIKILLSRGMKSCYVYFGDEKLRQYLHDEKRIKWC